MILLNIIRYNIQYTTIQNLRLAEPNEFEFKNRLLELIVL